MLNICSMFPVTEDEYLRLEESFGDLYQFAAWQLIKNNSRNNHLNEHDDVAQELRIALIRAASYYKRQVYIESCLEACKKHIKNGFLQQLVDKLNYVWENKTSHGANRQRFGQYQENLLKKLVTNKVPEEFRPEKTQPLVMDKKFETYCKAIIWNGQKAIGRGITKELSIRTGQVSLSEYDYLSMSI